MTKMYIAVLDEVPDFIAPTLVAHAVLGYHLNYFYGKNSVTTYEKLYENWCYNSFKKCVVRVNQKEFDKIAELDNAGLFYENTTLNGEHSCAVVVVDEEVPNVLKFAKLWKPKE